MLSQLTIKNYALIDELAVRFDDGLNIITGETGAGKSILLGGLSLVLGKRANLGQIMDSSKKCVVEATFDISGYNLESIFQQFDLDFDMNTIIRRELLSSGKSRAFINDTPVTLDVLNKVALRLIDIHSQHETALITDVNYLFSIVDTLAGNKDLLIDYRLKLDEYKKLQQQLISLNQRELEIRKEQDYNAFLLKELEDLNLDSEHYQQLEELEQQLSNLELIEENLMSSSEILESENIGVLDMLKGIKRNLNQISSFKKEYHSALERMMSILIELEDLSQEFVKLRENLISDPKELELVSQKLSRINDLLKKHGVLTVEELRDIRNQIKLKHEENLELPNQIIRVKEELEAVNATLQQLSNQLSKNRKKVIPSLKNNLEQNLAQLGIPNAKFHIATALSETYNLHGQEDLIFQFTANKGSQFKNLKSAASGGELSRIMLSIKALVAQHEKLPTIMFDEIDTGVSGVVAQKMGEIMKQLSQYLQVISITHLPQIAAKGNCHFKVYKVDQRDKTLTRIKNLNQDERVSEIAQMLGGVDVSDSALAHAKQLLN